MSHLTHEEQKEHARKVAEHHAKHASVDGMRSRDVYSDASGKPTAREYEIPEGGGYIREELGKGI